MLLIKAKEAHERLVPESKRPIGTEAGNTCGQAVEKVTLRGFKAAMFHASLLKVILVHRKTRDACLPQRHIDNPHSPALAIDGGGNQALNRAVFAQRLLRRCLRTKAADRFDQFGALCNDVSGIGSIDRAYISRVDEAEAHVGGPMPHRERRGFDQTGERFQGVTQLFDLTRQRLDL